VKIGEHDYFLDTLGNEYRMTDDINQLDENIEALDFRNKRPQGAGKIKLIGNGFKKAAYRRINRKIFRNTQLKILLLNNTRFTKLSPLISNLKNLQRLGLYGNNLTSLPAEIGQLSNLQNLELSGTNLSSLPVEIGQLSNLQNLELSRTNLSSLHAEIGQLDNLQNLDLRNNANLASLPAFVFPSRRDRTIKQLAKSGLEWN